MRFSLCLSILCISTYICFHLLSIQLFFFIPLYQSTLIPIFFNLLLSLYKSKFTAISFNAVLLIYVYSLHIHLYFIHLLSIHLYFFIALYQCRLMPISFYLFIVPNSRLNLSKPFLYLILFFVYPPVFVSIYCLSPSFSSYLFINPL